MSTQDFNEEDRIFREGSIS